MPAKKTTEPKAPKEKRVTRVQAANRVVAEITGKTTLAELTAKADALVVASGGKSKPGDAAYHVKHVLETAEALGVVKLVRPTDVTVERVKKQPRPLPAQPRPVRLAGFFRAPLRPARRPQPQLYRYHPP